jgi:hypothetical protein
MEPRRGSGGGCSGGCPDAPAALAIEGGPAQRAEVSSEEVMAEPVPRSALPVRP